MGGNNFSKTQINCTLTSNDRKMLDYLKVGQVIAQIQSIHPVITFFILTKRKFIRWMENIITFRVSPSLIEVKKDGKGGKEPQSASQSIEKSSFLNCFSK